MVKNRSGRKNGGEKCVVAVDGDADVLRGLRVGGVGNYKFWRVGALAADQRAGDVARGGVERQALGQGREIGIGADGEGVRRSATAGGDGAACVVCALCPARAGDGGNCKWAARSYHCHSCGGRGGAGGVGGGQRVGGGGRWADVRGAARGRGGKCSGRDGDAGCSGGRPSQHAAGTRGDGGGAGGEGTDGWLGWRVYGNGQRRGRRASGVSGGQCVGGGGCWAEARRTVRRSGCECARGDGNARRSARGPTERAARTRRDACGAGREGTDGWLARRVDGNR